jgi:mono/diheme cytochrome c family protein
MTIRALAFVATIVIGPQAFAADSARQGEQLARQRCAPCHIVAPHAREESADAPPFEVIARKAGFDTDQLINLLTGPHRKMNFALTPDEAAEIAAYMRTLAR